MSLKRLYNVLPFIRNHTLYQPVISARHDGTKEPRRTHRLPDKRHQMAVTSHSLCQGELITYHGSPTESGRAW